MHKRLYSSGDVRFVALDEYLSGLLDHLETLDAGSRTRRVSALPSSSRCRLRTDASINLGVVVTEWVTNAFKYAYPGPPWRSPRRPAAPAGRTRRARRWRTTASAASDGSAKGTGLGTRIVKAMAASMGAEIEYLERKPGTLARLIFSLQGG